MRIVFLGDLVGRPARELAARQIKLWRAQWQLDCVIVNGENAVNGSGINKEVIDLLLQAGTDVITTGNHVWGERSLINLIPQYPRVLRPLNYRPETPGRGMVMIETNKGQKVLVINPIGQHGMDQHVASPFNAMDELLKQYQLVRDAKAIIVDFHAETTSEKVAMGWLCDGRASLVVGTHTHIPTADTRILPGGTAYQTDAGMCGDYDSVIGKDKKQILRRFMFDTPNEKKPVTALGAPTLYGVYLETDDQTGLAKRVERICYGSHFTNQLPAVT